MVVVNEQKCVGCGQCAPFCPSQAIRVWCAAMIDRESCTGCEICVAYCPVDALEVTE